MLGRPWVCPEMGSNCEFVLSLLYELLNVSGNASASVKSVVDLEHWEKDCLAIFADLVQDFGGLAYLVDHA